MSLDVCVCFSVCEGGVYLEGRNGYGYRGGQQYIEREELLELNRNTVLSPVDLQNNNKNMKQKKYRIMIELSFSKYKQI